MNDDRTLNSPSQEPPVKETVLTVTSRTGDMFALVTFADGSYGLAREGLPLDGQRWCNGQMKDCVEALVRLAGLDGD